MPVRPTYYLVPGFVSVRGARHAVRAFSMPDVLRALMILTVPCACLSMPAVWLARMMLVMPDDGTGQTLVDHDADVREQEALERWQARLGECQTLLDDTESVRRFGLDAALY